MLRRLYFLFPDALHAHKAVDVLHDGAGVDNAHIHAVAKDEEQLKSLPIATSEQRNDVAGRLESRLWNINLAAFFVALLVLTIAVGESSTGWIIASLAVMVSTVVAGFLFTSYVPHTHLDNFRDALSHGEVLLMVDVPRERIHDVEQILHRAHTGAVSGGASWSVDAFGL